MGEPLAWFTFAGIFERYPDLHVVVTEGYAGWSAKLGELGRGVLLWQPRSE